LPNVIPSELFRLQKLPLLFLFKLGWGLESVLSALGDAGRNPWDAGEPCSDDRRSALNERRFLTLLGRFGLFEFVDREEGVAETVVLNCAGGIPVAGDPAGGVVGNVPGILEAGLAKYGSFDRGLFCRSTGLR